MAANAIWAGVETRWERSICRYDHLEQTSQEHTVIGKTGLQHIQYSILLLYSS